MRLEIALEASGPGEVAVLLCGGCMDQAACGVWCASRRRGAGGNFSRGCAGASLSPACEHLHGGMFMCGAAGWCARSAAQLRAFRTGCGTPSAGRSHCYCLLVLHCQLIGWGSGCAWVHAVRLHGAPHCRCRWRQPQQTAPAPSWCRLVSRRRQSGRLVSAVAEVLRV